MKDARKLDPTYEDSTPQLSRADEHELELPPIPQEPSKKAVQHIRATELPSRRITRQIEKASNLSLIVFIDSLLGFATGATLAIMLLLGIVDSFANTIADLLSF